MKVVARRSDQPKRRISKATELRSLDSRGGCPYASLVAAGVVLGGYQDQSRARWLRLRRAAEGVQNADNGGISGEHAESN
jgi:hypothetical protein